ncbi:SPOR domain-containing protein [bacterium]|nr:SPOR domain-containing protein [bacterium]
MRSSSIRKSKLIPAVSAGLAALCVLSAPAVAGLFHVQVAAVSDESLALQTETQLERSGFEPVGIHWRDGLYRVWAGDGETRDEVQPYMNELQGSGFPDAFIVELGPDRISGVPEPPVVTPQPYAIQVFSLSNPEDADRAAERARDKTGYDVTIVPGDGLYRVQLGPFESRDAAEFAKQVIQGRGFTDCFLVPLEQ